MEKNKFSTVMEKKDDIELIRITTSEKKDYQPEAIVAAKDELMKRNISASMYEDFTNKVEKLIEIEKETENKKLQVPLPKSIKIIAFIFPVLLFFVIGIGLMMFGYQKRGKELCKWTFFGCIFYFTIAMLIQLFF
ncbi:hypothetical protein [Bacteroides bouchesdurhonensis]|uniref:hypothetical protein n=1 Tax=Bacteroides bouchesdurhonensis TaxID=1841855 RepID=UPI00097F6C1D|nr:hypothetical protein [Bacteroides bouchesdurhonensis]